MDVRYYDTQMVMPLGNSTKLNSYLSFYLSEIVSMWISYRNQYNNCYIIRMFNSLEDLLRTADFVTLHVPLTPQTKNMIGAKEIALMKKGSYLLNASR